MSMKTDIGEIESGDFTRLFKAISDETRQRILVLLDRKPRCVSDLVKEFSLSQPTISRHLSLLINAGIVQKRREGKRIIYSLHPSRFAEGCLRFFINFDCCRGLKIERQEGEEEKR
jgi:DNA-binding transcriptional ArsR family regulator